MWRSESLTHLRWEQKYLVLLPTHNRGIQFAVKSLDHPHIVRVIETFDHHRNRKVEEEYDLVVLSSGFKPSDDWNGLVSRLGLTVGPYGFISADADAPVATSREGVFACGGIEAPKDIPETVIQAGASERFV